MIMESGLIWLYSLRPAATLLDGESCRLIGNPEWPVDRLGEQPDWFMPEIEKLRAWWDEERRIEAEEGAAEMSRMESEHWAGCMTH